MQTYTNFTSTDLSFTNLFVATGHDFHHSLAEKNLQQTNFSHVPCFLLGLENGKLQTNQCLSF